MTLLRRAARTLLASYFVVNGVKAVRDPEPLVPVAQPLTDKLVPLLNDYAPSVAAVVPQDTAALVRVNGAVQLAGGLALASGKGRRLGAALLAGSLIPSTIAKHPFWAEQDEETKAAEKAAFLKNSSLLGGVLLASADTEGKPSLAWRAQKGTQQLTKGTASLVKDTRTAADSALAEGAALVGTVVATSRKAQKRAAKEFEQARKNADKRAAEAAKARKQSEKEAKVRLALAAEARKQAAKEAQQAAKADARRAKQEKVARVAEKRANKNIKRGEN